MVDLSALKVGDTVVFRDGKRNEALLIKKYSKEGKDEYGIFVNDYNYIVFQKDGHCYDNTIKSKYDIIEIIPKEHLEKLKVDLHNIAEGDVVHFDDGTEHVVDNVTFDQNYAVITLYDFGTFEFNYDGTKFQENAEVGNIINVLHGTYKPASETLKPANDAVNHPSHYTNGGIECIAAIKASMSAEEYRGYLKGNVLKYLWRYESKGKPAEDLKKARVYLDWLIKEVEE